MAGTKRYGVIGRVSLAIEWVLLMTAHGDADQPISKIRQWAAALGPGSTRSGKPVGRRDRNGTLAPKAKRSVCGRVNRAWHFLLFAGSAAVIAGALGCGGGTRVSPVVHVGSVVISRQDVTHWTRAIRLRSELGSSFRGLRGSFREQALEFLISARWLAGEAAEQGRAVSDAEVERRLQESVESAPNGEREFERELSSQGRTIADIKLEIKAELASRALSEMVFKRVPPVTQADAAAYYTRHQAEFRVRELRVVDLIESIKTRAAAIALGKRVGTGSRFAGMAFRERVEALTPHEEAQSSNGALVRAIFAAKPGIVSGPASFNKKWVLILVRQIVPARTKPLAAVKEEIVKRLTRQRYRQALKRFAGAFRKKWRARTDCRPGFVVQSCRQFTGQPQSGPQLFVEH
jgi:parvulin-like peptidyl-prolyl isomerase